MKLAVIDNYDSFVYNLVRYLRESGGVTEVQVMRNTSVDFDAIHAADGILLSPGPGIPQEAGALMQVLETFSHQKPILGVCLGHQAIGEFFGARLEKAPKIYHGKSTEIDVQIDSGLFKQLSPKIQVGRYHSWQVADLPEALQPTAVDDGGNVMALEHKQLPIFGVQFHPESVLTPDGRQIIQNWINELK
jgi:anthranilate synthase component II